MRQSLYLIFSMALALATTHPAHAEMPVSQPATQPAIKFECCWTSDAMKIDGVADEPAWAKASVIDHFRQAWMHENEKPPATSTRVRLLWDRDAIYFFAEMQDRDLNAIVTEHDGKVWTDDAFELFFKPADDKPGYYEFNFNPANTVMDCFFPGPARGKGIWETQRSIGYFNIATQVKVNGTLNRTGDQDEGWAIEGRIPWKGLVPTGGRPAPGEQWGFAPCRIDRTHDVKSPDYSSAAVLKTKSVADFHSSQDYARLEFIGPDRSRGVRAPDVGLEVLPTLVTSKVVGSPDPPKPFRVETVYPNLKTPFPVFLAHEPGSNRMWVSVEDRPYGECRVQRFIDDPNVESAETLLDVNGIVYSLAFHPKFAENGFVFIGRNGPRKGPNRKSQIVRYHVDPRPPFALDPGSEKVIIEWESVGHDGCGIAFAPDGLLFVTAGDGSSDSDQLLSGQDPSRLLAKVLRIDIDRPDGDRAYSIPKDNPFVGDARFRPETWAYGMRNPWRINVDQANGDVWVGQNGQDQWEQVYRIQKGGNYGWSIFEGGHLFYAERKRGPHPILKPTAEHPHAEARSITGGLVSDGKQFPELAGAYVYGDYSTGKIWAIRTASDGKVTFHHEIADTTAQITSFALDTQGHLLLTDSGGNRICRVERSQPEAKPALFPKTLSQSGLFKNISRHEMADGAIPYTVNSPLWSDGAYKERFIAIPHAGLAGPGPDDDRRIGFTTKQGWDFPNETVLVKSFALERDAGHPASRRWIETRFFTKQEGEWVGYSYRWNEEQTDATLVEAGGNDQDFDIRDANAAGGVRKMTWHYPSRTECMVCHSRAANYVLGLQSAQMNRDQDYSRIGGRVGNQLSTLESLGLLRVDQWSEAMRVLKAEALARGMTDMAAGVAAKANGPQPDQRQIASSDLLPASPGSMERLADPRDESADVNLRARSYLQANCSNCHMHEGGGNAMIDLSFTTPIDKMMLVDELPQHGGFDLPDARLIASGHPERSVLLKRISVRAHAAQSGQMPPLATNIPDESAIRLMHDWIAQLPPAKATTGPAEPSR